MRDLAPGDRIVVWILYPLIRWGRRVSFWGLPVAVVWVILGWRLPALILAGVAVVVNAFLLGDTYGRTGGPKPR